MGDEQVPAAISADDWVATPRAVRELVLSRLTTGEALQQRSAELAKPLNQTSRNSSQPPSSDPPHAPPPSGRKPGGQPGHPGRGRSLKPVEQVKQVVVAKPTGSLLLGEDPQPARWRSPTRSLTAIGCWPRSSAWPGGWPTR